MDIVDIGNKLNDIAIKYQYKIANLQEIRKSVKGRVKTNKIFSAQNLQVGRDYAFHSGGRDELQFNIGEEIISGEKIFRYGVAYSLERSETKHRFMADLNPSRLRYNEYISNNPKILEGCKIWYQIKNKWAGYIENNEITEDIFKDNYFIFIGKHFKKSIGKLTNDDLHIILKEFDRLFPLYEYCLDESIEISKKDKRIMRLTWNNNNWEYPSGHNWTENNQKKKNVAYENKYGYGHEEWLFNERYRIEGFQYGYIRGIEHLSETVESIDEIVLYTIREDKQRFLVGIIKNIEIIEGYPVELNKVRSLFKSYFDLVLEELNSVHADLNHLKTNGMLVPNIKFKWDDVAIFPNLVPVSFLDGAEFNRFQAYKLNEDIYKLIETEVNIYRNFNFQPGKASNKKSYDKQTQGKKTKVNRRHSEITDELFNYFIQSGYSEQQLSSEKTRVCGNIVDFVVLDKDKYSLYEVKTSPVAIKNIRQAIGQLFEYAFLDDKIQISKLVIIGPALLKKHEKEYYTRICSIIKLPLEYWAYDSSKSLLNRFKKQ